MALTILEAAKMGGMTDLQEAITMVFAQNANALTVLPFMSIGGLKKQFVREDTLPDGQLRAINANYTNKTGVLETVDDKVALVGGTFTVDRAIVRANGDRVVPQQVAMQAKAAIQKWQTSMFKGDPSSNQADLNGLQGRIGGDQLVDAGATAGGDPLSLAILDAALDECIGDNKVIYASKAMARKFTAAGRATAVSGYVTHTTDALGRRITRYNDIPIVTVQGLNGQDNVLTFSEANPGGGSNVGTSLYICSMGEDGLHGIQNGAVEAEQLAQTNAQLGWLVEWIAGISVARKEAAVRLRGISDAAIVA